MAHAWWHVDNPAEFFGVKGERNAEQKARVARFRKEWGDVKGGAALNGWINGDYTATQLERYWGATNFNALVESTAYQGTIGSYEGDFGAYLQQEWDNLGSWLGDNTARDGSLGSLSLSPTQGTGGPKGAERGVTISAADLAQQNYLNAMYAAAEQANVPITVDSPDGAVYQLNVGQFDDVGLGEYKQIKEPYDVLDIGGQIMGAVIKGLLTAGVTGEIGSAISDVLSFAESYQTADEVVENVGVLRTIVDTAIENRDIVEDVLGTINTSVQSVTPEDVIIPEDTTVSLEPDADLLGTQDPFVQVEEGGDPFFQPDVTYPETDGKVEVEDVGYEVTEPEVTFETDDGGGGGETSTVETTDEAVDQTTDEAVDQTTDEAIDQTTDEAVDQTTDESVDQTTDEAVDDAIEDAISSTSDSDLTSTTDDQGGGLADEATGTEDIPFVDVGNGPWVYIGEGRWVQIDPDVFDQPGVVIDNGDGTFSVDPTIYENDENWVRTAEDPNWNPDNPEVIDVGITGDLRGGAGEPYEPEDQTVEEEGVDIFVDVFPETGDGTTQTTDTTVDTDGDNVPDENDDLPDDPTESVDTDDDGIGDNSDTDDDNDGVPDDSDANSTDPNTDGTEDDGDSTGGDSEETPDPIVVDPGDGSGDQDGGEDDGTGPGTGPGDGTGEGDGGDGTPGVEPVTKPKGMLGQAAFTPYKGGAISPQLPGFVEVAYQPKDYMAELNRIIGENSMFKGLI